MPSLGDDGVLMILVEFLSVGDIFRLRRALGRQFCMMDWSMDVRALISRRLCLSLKRRLRSVRDLGSSVARTRRCVECGMPTGCVPRVCSQCANDVNSPVALCTRRQIHDWCIATRQPYATIVFRLRRHVRVVRRGCNGRLYYWRSDVMSLLNSTISVDSY